MGIAKGSYADMGVALGRTQAPVPQHLLHGAEIGAAIEEMGREGVPEGVGMNAPDTRLKAELSHNPTHGTVGEAAAAGVAKDRPLRAPLSEAGQDLDRRGGQRNLARLSPLAFAHMNDRSAEIKIVPVERGRLGDAEARPIEQLNEGEITGG